MTAENESTSDENISDSMENATETGCTSGKKLELHQDIMKIFEFLSSNDKIFFKSQQIDDPSLNRDEKIEIAKKIYEKNRQTFLMRFGNYFEDEHLVSFERLVICDSNAPLKEEEHSEEIQLMISDYKRKLQMRRLNVKNRRYATLQELIKQGEYFSEHEMMKRSPELYQELIGQYLSEDERKQRDCYDVKNTTFSGILMHTAEQQEIAKVLKQADEHIQADNLEDHDTEYNVSMENIVKERSLSSSETEDDEIPASYRQQWGNFDNEPVTCATSRNVKCATVNKKETKIAHKHNLNSSKAVDTKFITAGERDLLRQEFIGLMHESFLEGKDIDFDYSQVDDNSQLDDLRQLNQDKEDAYFEASDNEDDNDDIDYDKEITRNDESEDELDVYMSHLRQHHSLQK